MIGLEDGGAAGLDFGLVRRQAVAIEGLAVEGLGGAEARRRLARIERSAGGVAVHIDHRSGHARPYRRRADPDGEVVEAVDPPVRVLAPQPGRGQPRLDVSGDVGPGVGDADDQGRIAPPDEEPVGGHGLGSPFQTLECRGLAPIQ